MTHTPNADTSPSLRRQRLLRACGVLLLLAGILLAAPLAAEKGKPLAVKDVTDLLQGSVPSSEVARLVGENGISFTLTDDLVSQFRADGAKDELIDALKKASKPATPPPPATGTLKVHSDPGGAQVYVNDEPKGVTSPAGELVLTGMPAGTYRLRVGLEGYKTWENSISVTPGEVVTPFVTLEKQNLPPNVTLNADRNSIEAGQSVTLNWTSLNASDVVIEPGVGKVAVSGSTSVSPRESTTYTLTAIGPGGIKTTTVAVSVTAAAAPAPAPASPVMQRPRPRMMETGGNVSRLPIPGASFKEIKFFESGYTPPPLGSRTYQASFNHRTSRYISWELHLTCPPVPSRVDFTIYTTWYNPNGSIFANQSVAVYASPGWTEPTYNLGRGWQRAGNWKRGTYRVELTVNGVHVATGYFTVY